MFERAEARGELRPGMTVLECTTGNAGIACAATAAIKGFDCTIVMPENMSAERKLMVKAYGANLVLSPGGESDIELGLKLMAEIRAEDPDRYWIPAEFENTDNVEAHRTITGPEIWEQVDGRLDAVVASQGTGGSISGIGRFLKERDPSVKVYTAEPAECPILSERRWGTHAIAGIGDGIVPPNLDLATLDGVVAVTTHDAHEMAKRLARQEGLLSGPSGGCNVHAALVVAEHHPELRRIVTLIPDTAMRYFSTTLFEDGPPELASPDREHTLDPESVRLLDEDASHLELLR
jgi:cysteine synthase A